MKRLFPKNHQIFFLFIAIAIITLFLVFFQNLSISSLHYILADEKSPVVPNKSEEILPKKTAHSSSKSKEILLATVKRLESLTSLSVTTHLKIFLDSENIFEGEGIYKELTVSDNLRSQRDRKLCYRGTTLFRLHLNISSQRFSKISSSLDDNVLDVICDRNSLWTYTSIEGDKRLTEIKLNEMAQILAQSLQSSEEKRLLEENFISLPCSLTGFPGLGGLSGMLRRMNVWYDFSNEPELASIQSETGTRKAWKITGKMKKDRYERIKNFLTSGGDERPELLKIIPESVEVFIGVKNPFPYHIHYYSSPNGAKSPHSDLMALSLTDIYENLNTINPEHFVYSPGGIPSTDITQSYIQELIPGIEF